MGLFTKTMVAERLDFVHGFFAHLNCYSKVGSEVGVMVNGWYGSWHGEYAGQTG